MATSGMVWWKTSSKQANCGTSGKICCAEAMSFRACGNVDRREMNGDAKLFEELRRDALVGDEFGTAVDDAMADGDRSGVDVIADGFGDGGEGGGLRFVSAVAVENGFAGGRADV